MKDLNPKNRPDRRGPFEVEPVPTGELEKVRSQETEPTNRAGNGRNIFIGTLNVFVGPMRAFIDPVKKVCYPTLSAHWDKKYKQPFAHHAWKILIFDLVLLFLASFLTVSLVLIYKFLTPVSPPDLVSVTLAWPDGIMSGAETELVLSYTNRTDQTLKDGRLKMSLQVADTRELVGWILSFGNGVRVLSPEALRAKVREEARKILRQR